MMLLIYCLNLPEVKLNILQQNLDYFTARNPFIPCIHNNMVCLSSFYILFVPGSDFDEIL